MPRVLNKRTDGIPAGAVYVGRPSKWGNPFKVGVHGAQGECCDLHKAQMDRWLAKDPDAINRLRAELQGKDLVCWCAPKRCHADYLLVLANPEERLP